MRRINPIVLGIVGDSAAGKTTMGNGIARILGEHRVTVIDTDDYHRYNRIERTKRKITALHPEGNYLDIIEQHLELLKRGEPVLKPNYNHATGDFDPPAYIEPRQFIIVEGMLGYFTNAMRSCYDIKAFLAPPEELRFMWKLKRDVARRGYTEEGVLKEMALRKRDSETYIQPQRKWADMVISFYPPAECKDETGARLNVSLILRPTLPSPDLSGVLVKDDKEGGISLWLDRDMGLPVDRLEIDGSMPDERAKQLINLLWGHIPGEHRQEHKDAIGMIAGATGQDTRSYPLAITQLLVGLHLLKAASGHYD